MDTGKYAMRSITQPTHVLQAPSGPSLAEHVRAVLDAFLDPIVEALSAFVFEPTAEPLLRVEESLQRVLALVGGQIVGGLIAWLHGDVDLVSARTAHARATDQRDLRHRGIRETIVHFLGGVRLRFSTPYLSEDREGRPGRRRGVGRRGESGGGCYPVLESLGIQHQTSPALASEVARQSARCSSFEEASEALAERGVRLDAKGVRRVALFVGQEALRQRDHRMEAAARGETFSDEFAGQRVVVSVDGGRVRIREGGQRGRRGKKGRRRFRTPWREPKLVTAYVIDEEGHKVRSVRPLLDATMGDADATFGLLIAELRLRGAAQARELIVVGDGATWIWDRVDALAYALDLPPEKVVRVADFFHAVEHLTAAVESRSGWDEAKKEGWVCRMRRLLKKGKLDEVLAGVRALRNRRNAKKIATEAAYFEKRRDLMRYDVFQDRGIPLGSGAVESAIRRVINLRLKGPGIFWRADSAEAMLHLRSYLKAGRWHEIVRRVIHHSADGRSTHPLKRVA